MQIKLALPKGRLQACTSTLLRKAGFDVNDYHQGSRSYRPRCSSNPELFFKVFQEKDIAVQVAIGNYDLGICGQDWAEEHMVKFTSEALVKIRDLGCGRKAVQALAADSGAALDKLKRRPEGLRIVSEYPNLAEHFALANRLPRFRIFPVWGAAEAYPPDNADLAIAARPIGKGVGGLVPTAVEGLVPVATILEGGAVLIANRNSLEHKDLSCLLAPLATAKVEHDTAAQPAGAVSGLITAPSQTGDSPVYLALADGHQQQPTAAHLKRAGIKIDGYPEEGAPRSRPSIDMDGVVVKVIRPQDMPFQVANGNFDLAITGRDWLYDHLCRFPASPVKGVADLGYGKVRIVAVVGPNLAVSSAAELRKASQGSHLRLASEYTNIVDRYASANHLTPCKVIPTWGASEAFLPEDADVLIENTQTGATLARNNLRIIDTLLESTACLIANAEAVQDSSKRDRLARLVQCLSRGVEAGAVP